MEKDVWHGLPEERFELYQNWRTPSGYLCGTYAASVLLAYYQDYLDSAVIPRYIRQKLSGDGETLANFLRLFVQRHGLPTIAWQVAHGISCFFNHHGYPVQARATMIGGWQRSVKRIDQGKPLIIGLNQLLGSTYGNHWVVAYAYMETNQGERYLKIHDNWGNYRAVIPAKWVNATVSLP